MDTLAFVKRQKEIDSAVKAGDFPRAYAMLDELREEGPLTAVQEKLLARSTELIDRKSQRSGAVNEPDIRSHAPQASHDHNGFAPERAASSHLTSRDSASGRRYPSAPIESEALAALEAIESRAATQVSGLLRQLPQDDLADRIAMRVLQLQRENQSLNQRLSQRLDAVPAQMEIITPALDAPIGVPSGPRTRIMQRREEQLNAPKSEPDVPFNLMGPQSAVNPALSSQSGPAKGIRHDHDQEDEDGESRHGHPVIPHKPSPASLRHAPQLAPPPEHLEPMPPPPSWLMDPKFKKLIVVIPILLLLGVGIFFGAGYLKGTQKAKTEAHLEGAAPNVGGFGVGDSYSDAVEAFALLEGDANLAGEGTQGVHWFRKIGVRIKRADNADSIKEIQVSASPTAWPITYSASLAPIHLGTVMERESVATALKAASFQETGAGPNATQVTFSRAYGGVQVSILYLPNEDGVSGKIASLVLRAGP